MLQQPSQPKRTYVLMTAAHNEETDIPKTIESVLAQAIRPERWVIVSDNSSDRTDEIIEGYAREHDFIRFLRITRPPGRTFGAKVLALNQGRKLLEGVSSDFIANLDGDISLDPSYFCQLMGEFETNPQLGVACGFVWEEQGGEFQVRPGNSLYSVVHAAQIMRRECYEAIGGYSPLKYGGEDWHAQISLEMRGWQAKVFPELHIYHHRHTGTGGSPYQHVFHQGKMDYSLGSYTPFEIIKCLRRLWVRPYITGAILRFAGFTSSYLAREKRPVSAEFMCYLRKEQKERVSEFFKMRART